MLELIVPGGDYYDEAACEFRTTEPTVLRLEHSLAALADWESKWKLPFLTLDKRTPEMVKDYLRCMAGGHISDEVLSGLSSEQLRSITDYVDDQHTATTFRGGESLPTKAITSEEIYGWMVAYRIPFECQDWNLNRLTTLIRVCGIQQNPKKQKESKMETLSRYRSVNEKRRAETEERLSAQRKP